MRSPLKASPFSTTYSTSTTLSKSPTIEIIPITANIPKAEPKPEKINKLGYGEEDLKILSETLTDTVPCLIWNKLPHLDPKLVDNFNHEFYLYCQRKGIDPRNYLFDEMGICIAGLGIAAVHYENYKQLYPSQKQKTEDQKLNAAFDHQAELEKEKQT